MTEIGHKKRESVDNLAPSQAKACRIARRNLGFRQGKTGEERMFAVRRSLAALFVLVAVVACDEDSPDTAESQSIFPDITKTESEACERSGGSWGKAANGQSFVCYRNLPDANQICQTSRDCAGICLARSRTCSPVTPFYGCHEVISQAGVTQTVCLE